MSLIFITIEKTESEKGENSMTWGVYDRNQTKSTNKVFKQYWQFNFQDTGKMNCKTTTEFHKGFLGLIKLGTDLGQVRPDDPNPSFFPFSNFPLIISVSCLFFFNKVVKIRKRAKKTWIK